MGFFQLLEQENNVSVTENGAIGYKTTGKALLDLNFAAGSMRSMTEEQIAEKFEAAWKEDKALALKWLFFLRDVREGMGERRSFREMLKWLGRHEHEVTEALVRMYSPAYGYLIPSFGRWDDLLVLMDTHFEAVCAVIQEQLKKDLEAMNLNLSVSLLAKWLPSITTSSRQSARLAKKIARSMSMTDKEYRKTVSSLRKYSRIVECSMSSNEWGSIDYTAVPSGANLKYSNAFLRHDYTRRSIFLNDLAEGKQSVKAQAVFPYDVVAKMRQAKFSKENEILCEAMWKEQAKKAEDLDKRIIVVADGSGSMNMRIGSETSVTAMEVASSLAILFAEKLNGEFHGKFITFSESPQIVDLSGCETLKDKLRLYLRHKEVANTNIERVFDLMLHTAIANSVPEQEMPEIVLVISDMEFDSCTETNEGRLTEKGYGRLFQKIGGDYRRAGYKLPKLVFWNVNSRSLTIPVTENENGLALLSGFSPSAVKMAMTGETDPYKAMLEILNSGRYDEAVKALA